MLSQRPLRDPHHRLGAVTGSAGDGLSRTRAPMTVGHHSMDAEELRPNEEYRPRPRHRHTDLHINHARRCTPRVVTEDRGTFRAPVRLAVDVPRPARPS